MGDVVTFPTSRTARKSVPGSRAVKGGGDSSQTLAGLRNTIVTLGGAEASLIASERNLSESLDRLGAQREMFLWRADISREIERAAGRLSAAIELGDLAALERLVPEFEALVRTAASTQDLRPAASGSLRAGQRE